MKLSEETVDRVSSEIAYVIMRNINGSTWADMYPRARKSLEDYQEDIRQDIASGLRRLNRDGNNPQRQDSLGNQLRDLIAIANKEGMYDAADFIQRQMGPVFPRSKTYRAILQSLAEKVVDYNPELVHLDDYDDEELCDLITTSAQHPDATQKVLIVGDLRDYSAAALVELYRMTGGDEGEPISTEPGDYNV